MMHPNTRVIVEAWKRLSSGEANRLDGPMAHDHPELVGHLFIAQRLHDDDYSISSAGEKLQHVFGRDLTDHNFLTLWTGTDRQIAKLALEAALEAGTPSLIKARAIALDGGQTEVEISLSPLDKRANGRSRILGLYQTISNTSPLPKRPVWRHEIHSLHPPANETTTPSLRLVANNT